MGRRLVTAPARLHVRDLVVSRGGRSVLHAVSFTARGGQVTGLLGPNGAGKTTILNAIAGVFPKRAGTVRVTSGAVTSGAVTSCAGPFRVGYAPQDGALYPPLTAAENLRVFARYAGVPRRQRTAAVDAALAVAQLDDRAGQRVSEFSAGLRRRLSFAVATLGNPEVLLLDEPTAGVDPQARVHVLDAIGAYARQTGAVVLLSSHHFEEVEAACRRVVVLDHGRVVAAGLLAQVCAAGSPPVVAREPRLVSAPWRPRPLGVDVPSLEAAFFRLTGNELRD